MSKIEELLKYECIIWDFNGTLLDDTEICIASINPLLTKRKLPKINHSTYRDKFTFPVKEYYKAIGFDFTKEAFEIPAMEFIDNYRNNLTNSKLFPEVPSVLNKIKNLGIKQYVLSAMEEPFLLKTLNELNIASFFKEIAGIQDHYAKGKIERGIKLLQAQNIDPKKTLLIGDTIHDYEVAEKLGIKVILVANGHQSIDRLQETKQTTLKSLEEIIPYL